MVNKSKAMRFTTTTVAPAGVENRKENTRPIKKQTTATMDEAIITPLNPLHTRIDVRAGKIIKLEISRSSINRIPITMVMAVKNAKMILYRPTFVPVAFAKLSSNVTAKILL